MKKLLLLGAVASVLMAGSCEDDAKIVEQNMIKAADNFEVNRRIAFYNSFQDQYLLTIEGLCSMNLNSAGTAFNVVCKTGRDQYKRHTLVLSESVTAFVEQVDAVRASAYHYRVTFKPQSLIGDVDFRGSLDELTTNHSEANQ